jgi:hypothetical protein
MIPFDDARGAMEEAARIESGSALSMKLEFSLLYSYADIK